MKLNTGMNRLGFTLESFPLRWKPSRRILPSGQITLMTHFARADEPCRSESIAAQLQRFNAAAEGRYLPRSMANSAAILRFPGNTCRLGAARYHALWGLPIRRHRG